MTYVFTSNHAAYINGKVVLFKTGDKIKLLGRELSAHSSRSPFTYNHQQIYIPNAVVKPAHE